MIGPYEVFSDDKGNRRCVARARGEGYELVHIDDKGCIKRERLAATKLPSTLAGYLRKGYQRQTGLKYLKVSMDEAGQQMGALLSKHPEIDPGYVLCYAPLPIGLAREAIAFELEALLLNTTADSGDIEDWCKATRTAEQFLGAPKAHPGFALVVADYAMRNAMPVFTYTTAIPELRPSQAPQDWEKWLGEHFDGQLVREAMTDLKWSIADALVAEAQPQQETQEQTNASQALMQVHF